MSKTPVRAVETSLRILHQLGADGSCRVTELADRLDTPKATIYYHLKTLQENGHVRQRDDQYELGYRTLELGGLARTRHPLIGVVEPILERLAREANEVAIFAVEDDGRAVVVDVNRPGASSTDTDVTFGTHLRLHCSAVGKALLIGMSEPRRIELLDNADLPSHTPRTVTNRSALLDHMEAARSDGFVFDRGEREPDVRGVASPIPGLDGIGPTAIGITGSASRLYDDRLDNELPHLLTRFADSIKYEFQETLADGE